MGNCLDRYCCFGKYNKRKYLRTRYNVERDFSIEFENLMDEDEGQQEEMNSAVTPRERLLLSNKEYGSLMEEQKQADAEIDAKLVRQEEELRMEEEAYYEARRQAARAAKRQREAKTTTVVTTKANTKSWVGEDDSDWEVAGGDDDFETFLESVKARSLAARTRALPSQVAVDQQSTSSVASKDKTDDANSSIDLEWEHEAGMQPPPKKEKRHYVGKTEESRKISELAVRPNMLHLKDTHETSFSNEFEWDSDLGENETADDAHNSENATLLTHNAEKIKR